MKIACIGDSLTEGRPGVLFFKKLIAKHPHIKFDNLGKPGETVKSLHTRLEKSPSLHRALMRMVCKVSRNARLT